jgi:cobalamin biosynthesis Mg chelatase CobN
VTAERRGRPSCATSSLVALVLLLAVLLGLAAPAGAAPAQECPPVTVPGDDCDEVTTTVPDVTTTEEEAEATTTTQRTTTTTRPSATTASTAATTTTATVTPSTAVDLLVPGDGTEGAESTTTTEAIAATGDGGPSDGTLIALVIVGLVLIAGVVSVLTWRYWVATRPPLLEPGASRGR